jgi:hypothetical protein
MIAINPINLGEALGFARDAVGADGTILAAQRRTPSTPSNDTHWATTPA